MAIHGSGSIFIAPFGGGVLCGFHPIYLDRRRCELCRGWKPHCPIGRAQYAVYTTNTGCTSLPTIVMGGSAGSGVSFYESLDHGSWYYDTANGRLYVHLQDGTNPSGHTLSATHRQFGVLAQSVNHVTIRNIDVAHVLFTGINFHQFSDATKGGAYYTSEYNTVIGSHVWNWGMTLQTP